MLLKIRTLSTRYLKEYFASLGCQQLVDQKVRSYPLLVIITLLMEKRKRIKYLAKRFACRLVLAHAALAGMIA